MKPRSSTSIAPSQTGDGRLDGASPHASGGYFDRVPQVAERSVLAFVVLLTLLGSHVHHGLLMRDAMIF